LKVSCNLKILIFRRPHAVSRDGLFFAAWDWAPSRLLQEAALLNSASKAFGDENGITAGDAALLRFAAAAEIIETDFWVQYNELGGIPDNEVPGGVAIRLTLMP